MRKATLGPVSIVLPAWLNPEEQYRRRYVGVTPASREIPGGDDKVAPETDIAEWAIQDWSAGEGDLRWDDSGRYNYGTGAGPASDGSGVVVGHDWAVSTEQAAVVTRGGSRLVAARDMNSSIYEYTGGSWSALWSIGGSASYDAISIAAPTSDAYYVLDDNGEVRKVESGSNATHYTATASYYFKDLVAYSGGLYGITGVDFWEIDQDTADTRTKLWDAGGTFVNSTRSRLMSTSDVGPIWLAPTDDGVTLLMEYNVANDAAGVIGELPKDVYVYDVAFHSGIYLVAYREAQAHAEAGDAFLYYQMGQQRGHAGPFRGGDAASTQMSFAGVIGDRLYVTVGTDVWAYDLSTGGIVKVADVSSLSAPGMSTTFGRDIHWAGGTQAAIVETDEYKASENQDLYSGRYDYGYLGLAKLVHTVTCVLEAAKAASDTVRVGYVTDGGSVTWLDDDFSTGAASHTWTVSTSSGDVTGTEIEWAVRVATSSASSSPKVIALYSDVSGAAARIEWAVAVDVGESSVNQGGDVLAALNSLRTSYGVVSWSDPFQVNEYTADQSFDVRVKDVSTPVLSDDGHVYATVVFQTVGTVGL